MLCQRFFILRTAWLYGRGKQNFIYKLLQRLQNEKKIYVVNDEFGSPTYTRDLALFIKNLIHTDLYGLYHVTNAGSVSRFTFAQTVMEMLGIDDVELIAIKTKDLSLKTKRPSFSALESIAIPCSGLCPLRDWQSALYDFLKHDLPSNFSMREGKSND
jgi:dTDP-4-dehydrorhamnose reductase